jgi:hypothetical protein
MRRPRRLDAVPACETAREQDSDEVAAVDEAVVIRVEYIDESNRPKIKALTFSCPFVADPAGFR